jgi:hypothetical protein
MVLVFLGERDVSVDTASASPDFLIIWGLSHEVILPRQDGEKEGLPKGSMGVCFCDPHSS